MCSHDVTMDDVMKDVLVAHAFSNSAKMWKTCEEQLIKIETDWEQLFNSFRKHNIYATFINFSEQHGLNWKNYNFERYHLFLGEWKQEIQDNLIKKSLSGISTNFTSSSKFNNVRHKYTRLYIYKMLCRTNGYSHKQVHDNSLRCMSK